MQIKKSMRIDSMDQLYNILKEQPQLAESNNLFLAFMDDMYEVYNGCDCLKEQHEEFALNSFIQISESNTIISLLKIYFQCDEVVIDNGQS